MVHSMLRKLFPYLSPEINKAVFSFHFVAREVMLFLIDIVNQLDLGEILSSYDNSKGGQPAYHPRVVVALLLYAYCVGVPGSRKIEQATYHSVPFRVLAGGSAPRSRYHSAV